MGTHLYVLLSAIPCQYVVSILFNASRRLQYGCSINYSIILQSIKTLYAFNLLYFFFCKLCVHILHPFSFYWFAFFLLEIIYEFQLLIFGLLHIFQISSVCFSPCNVPYAIIPSYISFNNLYSQSVSKNGIAGRSKTPSPTEKPTNQVKIVRIYFVRSL